MPELPAVEVFKRYVDATSLHQKIVHVHTPKTKVLKSSGPTLRKKLTGRTLRGTERRGKYLFIDAGEGCWLVMHFGMTGKPRYFEREEEEPKHTRLRLDFEGGGHFAFDCPRMFGAVHVVDDIEAFARRKNLGPDALKVSREEFVELFGGRKGQIKAALMRQDLICGLGNLWVDETLFQAKIHPKTRLEDLSARQLGRVYDLMCKVLKKIIDVRGRSGDAPRTWLIHYREEGATCPRCAGRVESITAGGRRGYYCPGCQGVA